MALKGRVSTADFRFTENTLMYSQTYEITCAGSPRASINQGL